MPFGLDHPYWVADPNFDLDFHVRETHLARLPDIHVVRHMADMETIHTYEGTETIQALIVGKDLTGVSSFA